VSSVRTARASLAETVTFVEGFCEPNPLPVDPCVIESLTHGFHSLRSRFHSAAPFVEPCKYVE